MKKRYAIFSLVLAASLTHAAEAQQPAKPSKKPMFTVLPWKNGPGLAEQTILQGQTGGTIPLWTYNINSPADGNIYTGTIVGRNPGFHGHRVTTIETLIVPVKLTFQDTGTIFDPTATDSCVGDSVVNLLKNSPIFQNSTYIMNGVNVGSTQYGDAFQRASFWSQVAGTRYHTLLGLTVLPAINVTVPVANGGTNWGWCGSYGTMDINWWDAYLQANIFPALVAQGVGPTTLPIFLFDSVFEYDGDPFNCCILGYHSAFGPNNIMQSYSNSSFDTSDTFGGDVSVTSHEIAEWLDDPDTNNPTPAWGHTGQVSGCQNNLEVGDPL